jgi:hypothetical protein
MDYFRDLFYIIVVFILGYLIFKNDLFKLLSDTGIIDKNFANCYILKYPNHAELHNKDIVYKIDIEEFFLLNPKLKGKIKIIERPEIDSTKIDAVRNEVAERKKIREEFNEQNFWEERKKIANRIV